jgi:hypothetical protein
MLQKDSYRKIFLLHSRKEWAAVQAGYCADSDLVLTTDFGLHRQVSLLGWEIQYLDHLVDRETMEKNNYLTYEFFRDWFKTVERKDIFEDREVSFGFAFRISIWSELVNYVRLRLNLLTLRKVKAQCIFISPEFSDLDGILRACNLPYEMLPLSPGENFPVYSFPISRWVAERLHGTSWKRRFGNEFARVQSFFTSMVDMLFERLLPKYHVFVQNYYPTRDLIARLKRNPKIQVIQEGITAFWNPLHFLNERTIPTYGSPVAFEERAENLIRRFRLERSERLVLDCGEDITDEIFQVIETCISPILPVMLRDLNCVVDYFEKKRLDLIVLIANLGKLSALVDCYAKSREIPVYLIANGIFANNFLDESKYATVINGYSESVKSHYFCGMANVVVLGDPRMDQYPPINRSAAKRHKPVVTVGASGFNNLDLNSYQAVEFDFMFDVLSSLKDFSDCIGGAIVRIKVRSNGYLEQYREFLGEYFPSFVTQVFHMEPFGQLLEETDLFISINSQTIIEASCSGIPAIYYKKDNEFLNPPWDGKSEVVMATTREELDKALQDFHAGSDRFAPFMDRKVLEKYVGPLDGKNLDRNYEQVLKMLVPAH